VLCAVVTAVLVVLCAVFLVLFEPPLRPSCICFLVVCFLLGNSLASEFYMPTFRNTVCSIFIGG
jgi:hypothetical protein